MPPQSLEILPITCLFSLLSTLPAIGFRTSQELQMLRNDSKTCLGCSQAPANNLPFIALGFTLLPLSLGSHLVPMCLSLGERVSAVPLAAQITERASPSLSLVVAVALDQVIASRIAGST
jgi:hypothetical protein